MQLCLMRWGGNGGDVAIADRLMKNSINEILRIVIVDMQHNY